MAYFVNMSYFGVESGSFYPLFLYPHTSSGFELLSGECSSEEELQIAGLSLPSTAGLVVYSHISSKGVVKYLLSSSCTHIATLQIQISTVIDGDELISILASPHSGLSTLIVHDLNSANVDFINLLAAFLRTQPQNSRLQQIVLRCTGEQELPFEVWDELTAALQSPHCKVDGLVLKFLDAETSLHVARHILQTDCKLRCLGFVYCQLPEEGIEILAQTLQSPVSKLSELSLCGSHDFRDNAESLGLLAGALRHPDCKLRQLDIGRCPIDSEGVRLLAQALQTGNCELRELILLGSQEPRSHLQECIAHLRDALRSPDCQLQVLRLFPFPEAMDDYLLTGLLAEALESEHCNLLVLDLDLGRYNPLQGIQDDGLKRLLQALHQQHCKLQCLNVRGSFSWQGLACVANFLRSKHCQLLYMAVHNDHPTKSGADLLLVEALEANFRMCDFIHLPWRNPAAEARAAFLLRRNRLMRTGGLLEQPQLKPRVAKLFICGHEEVGKTTLRKGLRRALRPISLSLFDSCRRGEPRTRGMELETLSFGNQKLVLCDLAGQEEYHAFHHYFVTGSNKDLFLVVCRCTDRMDQEDFEAKLQYWLRFIVSHRTTSSEPKPKVMVVVNFFYPTQDVQERSETAQNRTRKLIDEYQDVLDFGTASDRNVFGVVAKTTSHLIPIRNKLEVLLERLLDGRPLIPKICDDISSAILSKLSKGTLFSTMPGKVLFLRYSSLFGMYFERFCKQIDAPSTKTFQAALSELHNAGQIVFFPTEEEDPRNQIIVADSAWFCHELIGTLLAPENMISQSKMRNRSEPWIWREEDIKEMLRKQQCEEDYLDEILRYLERLELFYPVQRDTNLLPGTPRPPKKLLFPALLDDKEVYWAEVFADGIFFGRRLECQDRARTLLPSGVFSRLQVKLHKVYGNNSYKVGHGWISFTENSVATVVRFGGDTGRWEDRQWIDMMVCYPRSLKHHDIQGEKILGRVKALVYEICQGNEWGCPSVVLQESVLRDKESTGKDVVSLSVIEETVHNEGIGYNFTWTDGRSSPILDLFMPGELKELVTQQSGAVEDIVEEFDNPSEDGSLDCEEDASGLSGQFKMMWEIFKRKIEWLNTQDERRFQETSESLKNLRKDIGSLVEDLQQVERNILSSCSNHLVTQLLEGPLPLFPYLANQDGKWQNLKGLLGKSVQLHFMCESHTGPHRIETQKGVSVLINRPEWLVRIAPVLVPALKLFCCAARFSANVFLPGSHVFIPSVGWSDTLGLDGEAFQRKVLPKALNAFVEGVPGLEQMLTRQPIQESLVKELMLDVLEGKVFHMESDFQLFRVEFPQKGKGRISWVCADHRSGGKRHKNINPFS